MSRPDLNSHVSLGAVSQMFLASAYKVCMTVGKPASAQRHVIENIYKKTPRHRHTPRDESQHISEQPSDPYTQRPSSTPHRGPEELEEPRPSFMRSCSCSRTACVPSPR